MRCPQCQHENPTEANFCLQCGNKLTQVCPQCRQVLPPQARFCMACGQALTASAVPVQPHTSVSSSTFQVSGTQSLTPNPQPPISYTPSHLAAQIRAVQAAMEARGSTDGERK